ncbi:carbon-nitrogen hydrolase family protein [Paenibacillus qinlingensis]|uniref:carbon-nitrogen hydrolase family protein n=1 Tax=Paenibacillus qinlingensis TaxID=1837343 RepID=UPI001564742E|nr:carbon-nitrogen hydrolase family protein [Paenibacillus qinlingensis]NQX59656.1 carbon-nitrogen hydrolase family protein [Paenibacillus qinlingensis]
MPRKVNVISTCFNEELIQGSTQEDNLQRAMNMLDAFTELKPDLICFPEVFLVTGGDHHHETSEELTQQTYHALSKQAERLNSYIIASVHEWIGGNKYVAAWLFDREGNLAGRYLKYYPTDGEMKLDGITPGTEIPVFETDFGKVGIAICFDIGYPDLWHSLKLKGAELVVWPSAYDGGFPLEAHAWFNSYYVVSSVRTNHSKIIDKTGKILASTSKWGGWTAKTIDLEKQIFHIDNQYDKLLEIQGRLGSKVTIESFSQENIFTMESNDQEWPLARIQEVFQLETYKEYHKRSENIQHGKRKADV